MGGGGEGGKVGGPSSYNTLLCAPLAHWAIITSRSEKLCVLFCLLLSHLCCLLFLVFNWNAAIFLASKSSVSSVARSIFLT